LAPLGCGKMFSYLNNIDRSAVSLECEYYD
jgi:hypothetical protein